MLTAMRLVTVGAPTPSKRRVQIGEFPPIVEHFVAGVTQLVCLGGQQTRMAGSVGLMAVRTTALGHRLVKYWPRQLLDELTVTSDTQNRWSLEQQAGIARRMRVMTGRAVALFGRRMLDR
jgi:hypothetical protein